MSKTNYSRNKILDFRYGAQADAQPATWYLALFTSMPTVVGTDGTEASGGSYARVAITNNLTNFPAAVAGGKSNGTAFTFAAASAGWGTIQGFGFYDALTGGNLHDFAPLTTPKVVASGDTPSFSAGQLTWTET